ncbi:unnamed protein product [Thelazia callipaeda]|uniref:RRM domain-containing protein n=1 Tax=Thelazia callipaeda TaxID=103827 RepID=A0A0N5D6X8_THECL|nr:unnamed protein product [Thelazia callipaeda]
MMMSPAFATTMTYDPTINPYQMAYPAGATIYPAATAPFPVTATADSRGFEVIPHRIFVGGFPATTTELDLRLFFEKFGHVREAKVIRSSEGTSKGYGFITFDSEEEAKAVMQINSVTSVSYKLESYKIEDKTILKRFCTQHMLQNQEAEKLEFKGRRLNLGPAVRRVIHGPRFAPGNSVDSYHIAKISEITLFQSCKLLFLEYAIATPTGQLLTTSTFGGVTYAYPQSPFVVVPPNQVQPFIYSPVSTIAPAQYTLSNTVSRFHSKRYHEE